MTPEFDFEPAATALETVVVRIADDQLTLPTPCADTTVRDLLVHVVDLTEAFRQAATKESVGGSVAPNTSTDRPLVPDWRSRIPAQSRALVSAWREAAAWDGATEAGGVTMPASVMAMVALDELVIHCWDLAKATGQEPRHAPADLAVLVEFLADTPPEGTPGLFGPVVPIPAEAPALHRVLGLTGRDPVWTP
ncbi:TIGR03086 family metal-binding protein [Nocardia sp. NBC_00508]|uniref:TIGR03086 family metal-binding protein n=1 Tax=Nocardia sp. NBC_00508 TaxID=2975992 RepID=UPI002E7FF71C|nr:TIGR03086 family metal-binding protein [Nocardia sp. NBC_00508]WUD68850.1 TIGR03086 family metal-binding protein [Nocardia sp. NBC_00508]